MIKHTPTPWNARTTETQLKEKLQTAEQALQMALIRMKELDSE